MFACAECTKGKRKCSKESPKCERCRRLNKPCKYPNVDPKYRGLEDKIKKIEGEFQLVKNIISGSKLIKNQKKQVNIYKLGHLDLYTELIQVHMKYFSNFLPFISETRILSILPKKYHTSPLINAICIQPYQNLLYKKYPDKKAFLLKDNPFYQRTEELTPDQLEAFSIEIIQTLLLLAFLECGEGEFAIATIHLSNCFLVLNLSTDFYYSASNKESTSSRIK
ncbi:hypothetical protein K502DRAFT_125352 [Neoconidiobolus thromboides FSU 785]|nr:hypothetical protein K502DRAFT_125352 [Neoconidiobolus thromboides FSU 785]